MFSKNRNLVAAVLLWNSLALLESFQAQAAEVGYTGQVQLVYPMGDGSFALGFIPTNSALNVCSSAGTIRYTFVTPGQVGVNMDGVKNMLATALSAFALGKSIGILFEDSSNSCFVKRLSMAQ